MGTIRKVRRSIADLQAPCVAYNEDTGEILEGSGLALLQYIAEQLAIGSEPWRIALDTR